MELDLRKLESHQAHDLLTSSIIPRPIAWVSTLNKKGEVNLAPFSFFTGVSWNPPVLAFSVVNRDNGSKKDTVINIEEIKEFVINIVSTDLLSAMECSARSIPRYSISEVIFCFLAYWKLKKIYNGLLRMPLLQLYI